MQQKQCNTTKFISKVVLLQIMVLRVLVITPVKINTSLQARGPFKNGYGVNLTILKLSPLNEYVEFQRDTLNCHKNILAIYSNIPFVYKVDIFRSVWIEKPFLRSPLVHHKLILFQMISTDFGVVEYTFFHENSINAIKQSAPSINSVNQETMVCAVCLSMFLWLQHLNLISHQQNEKNCHKCNPSVLNWWLTDSSLAKQNNFQCHRVATIGAMIVGWGHAIFLEHGWCILAFKCFTEWVEGLAVTWCQCFQRNAQYKETWNCETTQYEWAGAYYFCKFPT